MLPWYPKYWCNFIPGFQLFFQLFLPISEVNTCLTPVSDLDLGFLVHPVSRSQQSLKVVWCTSNSCGFSAWLSFQSEFSCDVDFSRFGYMKFTCWQGSSQSGVGVIQNTVIWLLLLVNLRPSLALQWELWPKTPFIPFLISYMNFGYGS